MAIDLDAIGRSTAEHVVRWSERDTMLYALSVGAGAADPTAGLEYTTENSFGQSLKTLPTMAMVLGASVKAPFFGEYDQGTLLHGGQSIEFHSELAVEG